ncbi:O-acetyltransferase [Paraconexibacter sp. AEG42_29]|uniref:O-acetyltransferase n=1 Tax=Paraconexibacter sp. AEG42_29 TaxID=2997339 RepID=A0AAU7APA6_9ACTN
MSTPPTGGKQQRLAELEAGDALRAWALMSVVVFHIVGGVLLLTTKTYDFEGGYGKVAGSLMLGMQTTVFIFFALSAYLLSRPFIRAALSGGRFPSVRRYARHRVGRIVPAFWVAVAIVVLAYGMQGSGVKELLALLFFAQVYHHGQVDVLIDHAWSLDVEMLFYVLLPIVAAGAAYAIRRWRHGGYIAAAGILALVVFGIVFQEAGLDPVTPITQSPLGGLRSFLPGIVLAVLVVRWPDSDGWRRLPAWTSWALLALGLLLCWGAPHWAPEGDSTRVFIGTASGGCILAAVVIRQYQGGRVWLLFRGPVVAWIGERSYSIFLVHGVVYWALHDIADGQPIWRRLAITLIVALPAIMVAAQLLHVLVERPAMNYSRRPRPGDRVPVAAPGPAAAAGSPPAAVPSPGP